MAYQRGKFGIEYRPEEPAEETPWLLWAIGVAVVVALVYGSIAAYRWVVRWVEEPPPVVIAPTLVTPVESPVVPVPTLKAVGERPRRVGNLLMRLDRAVATTNIALQVATIEELRSLPGAPAADIDDDLAKMLGPLKLHMLFAPGMRNEWLKSVVVKRGSSATRIAAEYGTTVKCLEKLNGDVSTLKIGRTLKVMNHPQFRLSVYRKTGVADLSLDGRFFKRYYLRGEITGADGSYFFTANTRALLTELGVKLLPNDISELEMLLPKGANITVADFR